VGRYLIQSVLGGAWKPLGDPRNVMAAPIAAVLMVAAWGYFLIQGVRDPLGGINSLWPLFGIANQMLAAIALCLATTILLKMSLQRTGAPVSDAARIPDRSTAGSETGAPGLSNRADLVIGAPRRSPAIALVTFVPLIWLVAVTFTGGIQKIWHPDPRIGFLAQARVLTGNIEAARAAMNTGDPATREKSSKDCATATRLRANQIIDAVTAGLFLLLVGLIAVFSGREWILLLSGRKPAELRESPAVWLPGYAVKESGVSPATVAGAAALALALTKEWSGEACIERAQSQARQVCTAHESTERQVYVAATEARFNGVRRCC
jgi:carbon starvation protein